MESNEKDLLEKGLHTVFNLLRKGKNGESEALRVLKFPHRIQEINGSFRGQKRYFVIFDVDSDCFCFWDDVGRKSIEEIITEALGNFFNGKTDDLYLAKISVSDPYVDGWRSKISFPCDEVFSESLASLDVSDAKVFWDKALSRRAHDPGGAITAASSLLENVCLHILKERGVSHDKKGLKELFDLTSKEIGLDPKRSGNENFKRLVGGCFQLVQGLAQLRNSSGDAHGQVRFSPQIRHAELAVNLAGAMAVFLLKTDKKDK